MERLGALRCGPAGTSAGLKTDLEGSGPAESDDADGLGEVLEHYPQAPGTRPVILLLVLAPLLQGLGIEVRHHRTLLTRLAFPLIGLAAGGLHLSPSLAAPAVSNQVVWRLQVLEHA